MDPGKAMTPTASISSSGVTIPISHVKSMMHRTFFWGKDVEILFSGFPYHDLSLHFLALLLLFELSLCLEAFFLAHVYVKLVMSPTAARVVEATIHALQMGFAYLVMLSIASFNLGFFLIAITGHFLGFFIFGHLKPALGIPTTTNAAAAATAVKL